MLGAKRPFADLEHAQVARLCAHQVALDCDAGRQAAIGQQGNPLRLVYLMRALMPLAAARFAGLERLDIHASGHERMGALHNVNQRAARAFAFGGTNENQVAVQRTGKRGRAGNGGGAAADQVHHADGGEFSVALPFRLHAIAVLYKRLKRVRGILCGKLCLSGDVFQRGRTLQRVQNFVNLFNHGNRKLL